MPRSVVLQSLPQLVRAVPQDPQNFALEVPAPLVEKSEPLHLSANTVFVPLSTPDVEEQTYQLVSIHDPHHSIVFEVISLSLTFLQKYSRWTQESTLFELLSDDVTRYEPLCNRRTEPRKRCLRELSWRHQSLHSSTHQALCQGFQCATLLQLVVDPISHYSKPAILETNVLESIPSGSVMTVSGRP